MDESEKTVHVGAARGQGVVRNVCRQVVSDEARYRFWLVSHGRRMDQVTRSKYRREQIIDLRAAGIAQVHKTALVRYLRDNDIKGRDRDLTLAEFYGVTDPLQAAIAAHHTYLLSASTGFCAEGLLGLVEDAHGLEMIRNYREAYGQYFAMHSARARAHREGKRYLLSGFLPEYKAKATQIREQLMAGELLPAEAYATGFRRVS